MLTACSARSVHVDVTTRRAGSNTAARWSSNGLGTYAIQPVDVAEAPARGARVLLYLKEDATGYTEQFTIERSVKA